MHLYAAGVSAAELLLGRRLYEGSGIAEVRERILSFDAAALPFPHADIPVAVPVRKEPRAVVRDPPGIERLLKRAFAQRRKTLENNLQDSYPNLKEYLRLLNIGEGLRPETLSVVEFAGLANLLTIGSVKYAPRNWEKGLSYTDTMASLKRHLLAWERGEDYDPETKSHHMVSVARNALVLFSMQIRGICKKDLPRENYKGITADDAAN